MIEEDYRKYLSIDNGKGLLIKSNEAHILDGYGIDYSSCSSISDLIVIIGKYIDDNEVYELDDLEEVLSNLSEINYYTNTKK